MQEDPTAASQPPAGALICPTRADGMAALMASTIRLGECQKRQREHYHKCPTCVHFNARAVTPPSLSSVPSRDAGRAPGN